MRWSLALLGLIAAALAGIAIYNYSRRVRSETARNTSMAPVPLPRPNIMPPPNLPGGSPLRMTYYGLPMADPTAQFVGTTQPLGRLDAYAKDA